MTTEDLSHTVLSLPDGTLSLSITKKGLHIHRLLFVEPATVGGKTHDLVPGPEVFDGARGFQHCIVGRYVNRLPAQALKLPSGLVATPESWPEGCPGVCLHSGPSGWDQRQWDLIKLSSSTLFTSSEKETIKTTLPAPQSQLFRLISKDGEGGFPGELKVEVLVAIVKRPGEEKVGGGTILIVYRAALAEGGVETPINLTQHWGFNLEASVTGPTPESVSVKDHNLTIKSSRTLDLYPETSLPSGSLLPSANGTSHDHRSGKKIGDQYPSKGYDDFYVFDPKLDTPANPSVFPSADLASSTTDFLTPIIKPSSPSSPVATLSSEKTGITLNFTTNQQGVQFYSAPGGGGNNRKRIHGGAEDGSSVYGPENAAYLEFHAPYGSFALPELAVALGEDSFDTILKVGQVYNNFVTCSISGR
ncbi:galactose mutarotase-like domain-containing protein [Mrakia frigida]|uniref:galactose mutarotase-like domain-containing protein n=1 Tax=Mrakia frigida TaxID=29902 RepID=UPI003FCC1004